MTTPDVDPVSDYQQDERAIKAECDALAGQPGWCLWPKCDCEKLPDEVKRRRRDGGTNG